MIRAALVGVSGYGRWHLLMAMEQALVGRLRLVGVTIINPREEATITRRLTRQNVPVFGDYAEMLAALAGQVDLVLLPTGIQWHAEMAIAALRSGAHVLVEKPAAATLQDIDRMVAARDQARRLLAVGFQDLYMPSTHAVKRLVLRGEIGRLRRIIVRAQWPRPTEYYARNGWAGRLWSNGRWVLDSPVSNAYAHFVMLALFWAGAEPMMPAHMESLQAELYRVHTIESFDTAAVRLRTTLGVEILFYGSHAGRENHAPTIDLVGDMGTVHWVYERDYVVTTPAGTERHEVPDQLDTRLSVLEAVVARVDGGNAFVVEPELVRVHTGVVNALHEFFPIHEVTGAHVQSETLAEGMFRRIDGLDRAISEAASAGVLFSELGVPWARPAAVRLTGDYLRFEGCWQPSRGTETPATGGGTITSAIEKSAKWRQRLR